MFRTAWLLVFVTSLVVIEFAQALPQWDGFWGGSPQISIGSLVPGATVIEAIEGGIDLSQYRPKYLSIPAERGEYKDLFRRLRSPI